MLMSKFMIMLTLMLMIMLTLMLMIMLMLIIMSIVNGCSFGVCIQIRVGFLFSSFF